MNATGRLGVCGIGYLKNFDLQKLKEIERIISFDVPAQWLAVDIYGSYDADGLPVFEIVYREVPEKPGFSGDMSVNYCF